MWAIKNGDLDQVQEKLGEQVRLGTFSFLSDKTCSDSDKTVTHTVHHPPLQISKINESVDGRNLVHYAADYGQGPVLDYLISKSANVNVSAWDGICLST